VTGSAKGPLLRRVLDGDLALPVARVLEGCEVELYLDRACAIASGLTT